jgi:hypothetical protein
MALFVVYLNTPLRSRLSRLSHSLDAFISSLLSPVSRHFCSYLICFLFSLSLLFGIFWFEKMGKKKTSEARGKLGRYADTPKAIAVFRHVYKVPDNVGLKYVHWNDALNLATWDLLIPMVAVVEGGFASL